MINSTPGGLFLIASSSLNAAAWMSFINLESIYSMIAAIAVLWMTSYASTALAMRYLKRYGKN